MYLIITLRTDTLHHILRLFYLETRRQRDRGDVYIFQAEGAVTTATRQVHMTKALAGVVQMADAVFL